MEAVKAGALSVVEKPVATSHAAYTGIAARLYTQLAIMSEVKVVRQRPSARSDRDMPLRVNGVSSAWRLLTIGASTGGPNALLQMLGAFGGRFPLPIVIVQHMTASFLDGFARWLSGCGLPVSVVNERVLLEPGKVYLAPGDAHVVVDAVSASPNTAPPVRGHRPAANVLFSSAARHFGSSAIGVLLTGMGDDGADGLREIRSAGGFTIAEAESTAVVYGMPAAAVSAGAVCESLPLDEIAPRILEMAGVGKEVR
jgi:two-component system chemotaxis response regulator CheB